MTEPAKPKTLTLTDDDIVTSRPKPAGNDLGRVGQAPDAIGGGSDPDAAPAPKKPFTPTDPDA